MATKKTTTLVSSIPEAQLVDPAAARLDVLEVPESQFGSNDEAEDPTADPTEGLSALNGEVAPKLPAGFDMAAFGEAIGNAVAAGIARTQPRRKVTFGEYDPKTAFQPDKNKTLKLNRDCFQNGAWMKPTNLFNEEIDALNKITHSGRYIDRLVEVVLIPNGAVDEVHLRYNNKTMAQRLENKGKWKDLADMLRQILVAQALERAEDEVAGANRARQSARR